MAQVQGEPQTQIPQQQGYTSVPMPLQYHINLSEDQEQGHNSHGSCEEQQGEGEDREAADVIQGNTKFSVPIPVSAETPSPETSTSHGYHGAMTASNIFSDVNQNLDVNS